MVHGNSSGGFVTIRSLIELLVWKRVVMRYADTNWKCLKSRVHISRLAPPSDGPSIMFFLYAFLQVFFRGVSQVF